MFDLWSVLASLVAAASLLSLVYGGLSLSGRGAVRARLLEVAAGADLVAPVEASEPVAIRLLARFGALLARVLPSGFVDQLATASIQAGLAGRARPEVLLGARGVAIPIGLFLAYAFIQADRGTLADVGAVLIAPLSVFSIDLYLRSRVDARRKAAQRDLPTVLDLLTLTLAAGMGFDNAFEAILGHFRGPLVDELNRYLVEVRTLGAERAAALRSVAFRLGDPQDLVDFVDAVNRAQLMGTGLLAAVESQMVLLRQERRRRIAAEAQRAPVRMLIPMTLFMLPVLMLVTLAPVGLRVLNSIGGLH